MSDTLNRLQAALRVLMEWRDSDKPPSPDAMTEVVETVGQAIEELGGIIEWEDEEIEFVQTYLLQKYGVAADADEIRAVIEALEAYEESNGGGGVTFRPDFGTDEE